jgi:alkaline phosphatase D
VPLSADAFSEFAARLDIHHSTILAPFDNVKLYPWLAHLLSLQAPKTDGSLNILAGAIRDNGQENSVDAQIQGVTEE